MEASQAGEAAQAQGSENGQEGQEQGSDVGQLLERFEGLHDEVKGFNERFDTIESRIPEEDGDWGLEGDQGEDDLRYITDQDGNVLGAIGEDGQLVDPGDLQQEFDPNALVEQAREQARQEAMQQVAPILEHFADQQIEQLEQKYPQLQDEEYAGKIVQEAEQRAASFVGGDPQRAAELAQTPGFVEMTHLARLAREQAQSETPAGAVDDQVFLEGAGASQPGAGEGDESDRIADAYGAGRNSSFWR